jgi:hypothetical protein
MIKYLMIAALFALATTATSAQTYPTLTISGVFLSKMGCDYWHTGNPGRPGCHESVDDGMVAGWFASGASIEAIVFATTRVGGTEGDKMHVIWSENGGGEQQFESWTGEFELVNITPGATYKVKVQDCIVGGVLSKDTCGSWSDYRSVVVPPATIIQATVTFPSPSPTPRPNNASAVLRNSPDANAKREALVRPTAGPVLRAPAPKAMMVVPTWIPAPVPASTTAPT